MGYLLRQLIINWLHLQIFVGNFLKGVLVMSSAALDVVSEINNN